MILMSLVRLSKNGGGGGGGGGGAAVCQGIPCCWASTCTLYDLVNSVID